MTYAKKIMKTPNTYLSVLPMKIYGQEKKRDSIRSILNNNKTEEVAKTINNILTRKEGFQKKEPNTAPLIEGRASRMGASDISK